MCLGIESTCGLLGQGLYSLSGLAYSALAPIRVARILPPCVGLIAGGAYLVQSEVFGHGLGQVRKP